MSIIKEKNLKVIAFSGKQEDWKFWEVKFLAKMRHKGFREILLGTVTIPKDSEIFDLTKPTKKAQSDICEKMSLLSRRSLSSPLTQIVEEMEELHSSWSAATRTMTTATQQMCGNGWLLSMPNIVPIKKFVLDLRRSRWRYQTKTLSFVTSWTAYLQSIRFKWASWRMLWKCYKSLMIQDMCNELNLKLAWLKYQTMEQLKTNQALAAFCRYKGKCTKCSKFGHKLTKGCSKTGYSEEGRGRIQQEYVKTGQTKALSSDMCVERWAITSLSAPRISQKPTGKQLEKSKDTVLMTVEEGIKPCNNIWIACQLCCLYTHSK